MDTPTNKACNTPGCKKNSIERSSHCRNCSNKYRSFYKEYKKYQHTQIDPFFEKDLSRIETYELSKHKDDLKAICDSKNKFEGNAMDKNRRHFFDFLQQKLNHIDQLLKQKSHDKDVSGTKLKYTGSEFVPRQSCLQG